MDDLRPSKNEFSNGKVATNTAQIHAKWTPELNKKTMLENIPKQIKKCSKKTTPKSVPKRDTILEVAPLGVPLVAQTAFGHQKWAPSAPKMLPMIER